MLLRRAGLTASAGLSCFFIIWQCTVQQFVFLHIIDFNTQGWMDMTHINNNEQLQKSKTTTVQYLQKTY